MECSNRYFYPRVKIFLISILYTSGPNSDWYTLQGQLTTILRMRELCSDGNSTKLLKTDSAWFSLGRNIIIIKVEHVNHVINVYLSFLASSLNSSLQLVHVYNYTWNGSLCILQCCVIIKYFCVLYTTWRKLCSSVQK